jgi:hypothetical protein
MTHGHGKKATQIVPKKDKKNEDLRGMAATLPQGQGSGQYHSCDGAGQSYLTFHG